MTDIERIIYKMLLIRRVEEEIINRYPKQLIRSPVHLSIGQEAVSVGVCHHLKKEDKVFSTHRCHAAYLAKGGNLEKMILEIHGKVGGCTEGRGSSMHLMDTDVNVMSIPIVASAIPLAVGAAMANKIDGNGNIVVCFFGDAAVEEGVFHESLNFASLMQLPIIFVCENNQYSVDTHISKRQPREVSDCIAFAHNIGSVIVKSDNVFEVARVFEEIIMAARDNVPGFIVMPTQRSHVHCGVEKEFELDNDPIKIAREYDLTLAMLTDSLVEKTVIQAFDTAEIAPLPTPDMAARFVYA